MKHTLDYEPKTFGDWAYIAIAKHFNKILKHESAVLEDTDPEELHQMRVGMRRLRSAIVGFAQALNLPNHAQEKKVGKIAKVLGKLRDIDVLEETLKNQYYPTLPQTEQKYLDKALSSLAVQRHKSFKEVVKTLNKETYLKLKKSFDEWLNQPVYQAIAQISIHDILPDLLLPHISQLILHPGWVLGVKFSEGQMNFSNGLSQEEVESLLNNEGLILHDLRKEAKRTRYNMELFTQFYGEMYQEYLGDIQTLQSVLGDIQDSFVLIEFLDNLFGKDITGSMPIFSGKLKENRYCKWQEWEILQRKFLDNKTRKDFHLAILQPSLIDSKIEETQDHSDQQHQELQPLNS